MEHLGAFYIVVFADSCVYTCELGHCFFLKNIVVLQMDEDYRFDLFICSFLSLAFHLDKHIVRYQYCIKKSKTV